MFNQATQDADSVFNILETVGWTREGILLAVIVGRLSKGILLISEEAAVQLRSLIRATEVSGEGMAVGLATGVRRHK